jgi:hypothetical protein
MHNSPRTPRAQPQHGVARARAGLASRDRRAACSRPLGPPFDARGSPRLPNREAPRSGRAGLATGWPCRSSRACLRAVHHQRALELPRRARCAPPAACTAWQAALRRLLARAEPQRCALVAQRLPLHPIVPGACARRRLSFPLGRRALYTHAGVRLLAPHMHSCATRACRCLAGPPVERDVALVDGGGDTARSARQPDGQAVLWQGTPHLYNDTTQQSA